jgi:hypothetical protein
MRRKLYVSQIDDLYTQKNFQTFLDLFQANPFLKGDWTFLEFQVTSSGTQKVKHPLGYVPKDVLLLSVTNGSITFNYGSFDVNFISINATVTTSPMNVRVFLGRYTEDTINV